MRSNIEADVQRNSGEGGVLLRAWHMSVTCSFPLGSECAPSHVTVFKTRYLGAWGSYWSCAGRSQCASGSHNGRTTVTPNSRIPDRTSSLEGRRLVCMRVGCAIVVERSSAY